MGLARNWAYNNKNRFFTSDGATSKSGYLDGQCVSLVKWFLNDNAAVQNPFGARGNAKDYGDTLTAQGYAYKVNSPIEGDLVVWKQMAPPYGHIGVYLGDGTVFESNVGVQGVSVKNISGYNVYGASINNLNASFRIGPATYYRIRSYKGMVQAVSNNNNNNKGGTVEKTDLTTSRILSYAILGRDGKNVKQNAMNGDADTDIKQNHLNHDLTNVYIKEMWGSIEAKNNRNKREQVYKERDSLKQELNGKNNTIRELENKVKELNIANDVIAKQLQDARKEQASKQESEKREQKENIKIKDGAIYKTLRAGLYASISGLLAYIIGLTTETSELFGVYAPAVNMVLVAVKKWLDDNLEREQDGTKNKQ